MRALPANGNAQPTTAAQAAATTWFLGVMLFSSLRIGVECQIIGSADQTAGKPSCRAIQSADWVR